MAKGFFTQGVCVLLREPVSRESLEAALSGFDIRSRQEAGENWAMGGPGCVLTYRPDVNGHVSVDLVDRPWPDSMGDPKSDPDVFGAWSMGFFGPGTFPGGLRRAGEQSWAWEGGKTMAAAHKAFVRLRTSYVFGAGEGAPLMPADCDPADELAFLTKVGRGLLELPEALCWFNPNGEVLLDRSGLDAALASAQGRNLLPLDVWTNVRMFQIGDGWLLMDTVGNSQLDRTDVEACFLSGKVEPGAVAAFLRNVAWYLYKQGDVIKDGDTLDGPTGKWQARRFDTSLVQPPRRVHCCWPLKGKTVPQAVRER